MVSLAALKTTKSSSQSLGVQVTSESQEADVIEWMAAIASERSIRTIRSDTEGTGKFYATAGSKEGPQHTNAFTKVIGSAPPVKSTLTPYWATTTFPSPRK